jgi:hypothetical protein
METKTKEIYSEKIEQTDYKDWFISDFREFTFEESQLKVKEYTIEYEDGKTEKLTGVEIKIQVRFDNTFFLNRTGYLNVHYIDFVNKVILGYVKSDNFKDVLKPESYERIKDFTNNSTA